MLLTDSLNKTHNINCLQGLKALPDNCIDCCVTSPPYYGLRDYNTDAVTFPACTFSIFGFTEKFKKWTGNYGQEPSPKMFVAHTVLIFEQVLRVLTPTGTLWLNFGDSYASSGKNRTVEHASKNSTIKGGHTSQIQSLKQQNKITSGLKEKDLIGIPWMVAFALRDAGWYLRQDIIWSKPNPMPESVTDRCTKAHEYFFMLTKSPKYYYDAVSIKTASKNPEDDLRRMADQTKNNKSNPDVLKNGLRPKTDKQRGHSRRHDGFNDRWDDMSKSDQQAMGANKRSVWTVSTKPFSEAHFATFPPDLIVDCIKAGSGEHGCCADCGSPYTRQFDKELMPTAKASYNSKTDIRDVEADKQDQGSNRQKSGHKPGHINKITTTGWVKTCKCDTAAIKPAIILDPFMGAGTTGLVAKKMGRNYIGYELNPAYIKINEARLYNELGLFL